MERVAHLEYAEKPAWRKSRWYRRALVVTLIVGAVGGTAWIGRIAWPRLSYVWYERQCLRHRLPFDFVVYEQGRVIHRASQQRGTDFRSRTLTSGDRDTFYLPYIARQLKQSDVPPVYGPVVFMPAGAMRTLVATVVLAGTTTEVAVSKS